MGVEYFPPPSIGGSPSLLTGHILYVDIVNGNNGTGTVGNASKPYLTIGAAKAAASSGDLVRVRPGAYTVTDSILKNGVNWNFDAGASVSRTGTVDYGILDDKGVLITCNVLGFGAFSTSMADGTPAYVGCVASTNTGSNIYVEGQSILTTQGAGGSGYACGINANGGTVRVRAVTISGINNGTAAGQGVGFFWWQGLCGIECQTLIGTNNAISTQTDGTDKTDAYATCLEMYTTGAIDLGIQGVINNYGGSNPNAALWVKSGTVTASLTSGYCAIYTESGSGTKVYLDAQKTYGQIICRGGLVYLDSDKSEALADVGSSVSPTTALFAQCTGGTLRYNVRQHDPKAFAGIAFLVDGGTFISNEIEYTAGSGSDGLSVSGGTARLNTAYLNTAANNAGNPVAKSGGTLVLNASILVAEGASESITAGSSQDVVAMGCWTNRDVNVNVTVTTSAGLTIDSSVI